jgi:hypothetical protein
VVKNAVMNLAETFFIRSSTHCFPAGSRTLPSGERSPDHQHTAFQPVRALSLRESARQIINTLLSSRFAHSPFGRALTSIPDESHACGFLSGQIVEQFGQNWNRTSDTRIFSPLLYRLSYLAKEVPKIDDGGVLTQ